MRLEVLGGLRLLDAQGQPVPVQRRRLALLALVAVAGRRGMPRDRLLALLWPDATEASARHALDQALFALRRQIGAEAFVRTDAIALNAAVVEVDLWEFLQCLDAGTAEAAAALYHGPLLDGFAFDESPDFSHWLDAERAHLAERHLVAVAALGDAALARGDAPAALQWWRRYQRADPLSARGAAGLLRALSANSDRAAALQFGRAYEALVREELGCSPDPAVRAALAAALITQEIPSSPLLPAVRAASTGSSVATLPASHDDPPQVPTRPARRPRSRWLWTLGAGTVALGLMLVTMRRVPEPAHVASGDRAVIFPFRVADTTGSLGYLGEAMVDLLATKFAGDEQFPVVPPGAALAAWRAAGGSADGLADARLRAVAQRLGAGRIVTGSAVASGNVLTLSAAVTQAATGRAVMTLEVRGPRDSVPAIVDRLAAQLLLMTTTGEPQALGDLGATSMAALRAFVAGQAAARNGRFEEAIRRLREALDRDSSFALAALHLVDVAEWVGPGWTWNPPEVRREALRLAWAHRDRLSTRDRALLVAQAGPDFPVPSSELARLDAWSRAVRTGPERADAWLGLGDHLFHSGPLIGSEDAHERSRFALARAVELDSGRVAALGHLADLHAMSGDTAGLRQVAAAYLRVAPTSDLADFVRWRLAVGTGDGAQLAALRQRWDRMPLESLMRIAVAMQMDAVQLDRLDEVATVLDRRQYESADPQQVSALLADLELNRGRPTAAARRTATWRERVTAAQVAERLAGDALLAGGDRSLAGAALAALGVEARRSPGARCALAMLQAADAPRSGHQALRAMERAGSARRANDSLGWGDKNRLCALTVRVMLDDGGETGLAAVRRLDSAMRTGPTSFDVTVSGGENLVLASAWARHGHASEALAAVRRRGYGGLWPTRFLADALREEGFLAAAVGDTSGAIRAWRHYLALRVDVEPPLSGERERVTTALAAITARDVPRATR